LGAVSAAEYAAAKAEVAFVTGNKLDEEAVRRQAAADEVARTAKPSTEEPRSKRKYVLSGRYAKRNRRWGEEGAEGGQSQNSEGGGTQRKAAVPSSPQAPHDTYGKLYVAAMLWKPHGDPYPNTLIRTHTYNTHTHTHIYIYIYIYIY
jgi:hypothetical protein